MEIARCKNFPQGMLLAWEFCLWCFLKHHEVLPIPSGGDRQGRNDDGWVSQTKNGRINNILFGTRTSIEQMTLETFTPFHP